MYFSKRVNANLENTNMLLEEVKVLNDRVYMCRNNSKKYIQESKALLKEYAVNKDNANVLIERLRKIKKEPNMTSNKKDTYTNIEMMFV